MATRYDWLRAIGKGDMNATRVVVLNRVPFFRASEAVTYVNKHYPEMTIDHEPIVHNPDMARKIANISQHELEYLIRDLETVHQELQDLTNKQETKVKAMEEKPRKSLMDDVELSVARDRLREYAHQTIGASQVIQRVRTRMYELQALAGR
jgi:hypothetical protein